MLKCLKPGRMPHSVESDVGLHCLFMLLSLNNDDNLIFYAPFNIFQVISRIWKGDNDRLCAMECHTVMS